MELTFIVSAVALFLMIALRMLEIKFERPIILAHLTWPADKRLRVHFKKIPALIGGIKAYVARMREEIRSKAAGKLARLREGGVEYVAELQESLRGKRALSRGSVSFFLLNISDYGREKGTEAVAIPVEDEQSLSSE